MDAGKRRYSVAAVIIDRANYGRLLPLLRELRDVSWCDLSLILGGSFVLDRFGHPADMLEKDGLSSLVADRLFFEIEGNRPDTRAISIGLAIQQFTATIRSIAPDCLLVIGDRFEAFAAAAAAFYSLVPIAHIQGDEKSGTTDDVTRLLIRVMSSIRLDTFELGCPSVDLAVTSPLSMAERSGSLVIFHPDDLSSHNLAYFETILDSAEKAADGERISILWPNIDPLSDAIAKRIRERANGSQWRTIKNLHPGEYLSLLAGVRIAIGNSSSFVREAGYFGTPVILVGDRQRGRPKDDHATRIDHPTAADIKIHQSRRFDPSWIYGKPGASRRILERLEHELHRIYRHGGGIHARSRVSSDLGGELPSCRLPM